jgi:cytochrome c peroxidase
MYKKGLVILALVSVLIAGSAMTQVLSDEEELGKAIFFEKKLSIKNNQSCASCHAPDAGWTGPIPGINKKGSVYFGSVRTRFGNRRPPTVAYAGDSPPLYYDADEEVWVGGMFWDGRATGWTLGDPLAEQAQGPFLNPLEQGLPDPSYVVDRVCNSKYSSLFKTLYGDDICSNVPEAYNSIAQAIAAYERSPEVDQFSSKYDAYLAGKATLTAKELWGLELFRGEKAMCAACHVEPLFTDFTYDNLGLPRNPQNPFYHEPEWNPDGLAWVDSGLGEFLKSEGYEEAVYLEAWGKMKVPTLRNVDKRPPGKGYVKAFGHNGYFKSLKGIVHFYNTRDVKPRCPDDFTTEKDANAQGCWPGAEVIENVNVDELGDLGLTPAEEDAIVDFLKTLSDGYSS